MRRRNMGQYNTIDRPANRYGGRQLPRKMSPARRKTTKNLKFAYDGEHSTHHGADNVTQNSHKTTVRNDHLHGDSDDESVFQEYILQGDKFVKNEKTSVDYVREFLKKRKKQKRLE